MPDTKPFLTPEDIDLMESKAGNLRDLCLVRVTFRRGLRISETLNLAVEDIDWSGYITVLQEKKRTRTKCPHCNTQLARRYKVCPMCAEPVSRVIEEESKKEKRRVLEIDNDTLGLLRRFTQAKDFPRKKKRGDGAILLFPVTRQQAYQIIRDMATRAGLPLLRDPESGKLRHVSPHRLRDAYATHFIDTEGEAKLRDLQADLGHEDIQTTAHYVQVNPKLRKERLVRLWGKESPGKGAPGKGS